MIFFIDCAPRWTMTHKPCFAPNENKNLKIVIFNFCNYGHYSHVPIWADSKSKVHFETGSSIMGVSAHAR